MKNLGGGLIYKTFIIGLLVSQEQRLLNLSKKHMKFWATSLVILVIA